MCRNASRRSAPMRATSASSHNREIANTLLCDMEHDTTAVASSPPDQTKACQTVDCPDGISLDVPAIDFKHLLSEEKNDDGKVVSAKLNTRGKTGRTEKRAHIFKKHLSRESSCKGLSLSFNRLVLTKFQNEGKGKRARHKLVLCYNGYCSERHHCNCRTTFITGFEEAAAKDILSANELGGTNKIVKLKLTLNGSCDHNETKSRVPCEKRKANCAGCERRAKRIVELKKNISDSKTQITSLEERLNVVGDNMRRGEKSTNNKRKRVNGTASTCTENVGSESATPDTFETNDLVP